MNHYITLIITQNSSTEHQQVVHLAPTDSVSAMTPYTFIRDECTLPTFAELTWDWSSRIKRLRIRLNATVEQLKEAIAAIPDSYNVKVSH